MNQYEQLGTGEPSIVPFNAAGVHKVAQLPQIAIPTEHAWAFGFYIRKVVLPKDAVIVTKTHGQRHSFMITRGKCIVRGMDERDTVFEAPHVGITEPGERREIYVVEETEWVTFQHPPVSALESVVQNIEDAIMVRNDDEPCLRDSMNRPKGELPRIA